MREEQPSLPDPPATHTLDITLDICPMTFVKTKLELEDMNEGEHLEVLVREGESLENVCRSSADEGHQILSREKHSGNIWRIVIRRGRLPD